MRMKPASDTSLNSITVTNICTARMKKARMTITQANSNMKIVRKLSKKLVNPIRSDAWSSSGNAASKPARSQEHTAELKSHRRIPYEVLCLKTKKKPNKQK